MATFHSLQVQDIRQETPETVSVAFDVPETLQEQFQFTQGQYLTLKTDINGEEVRRSYSICVSPQDAELRVAIKKVPEGKFSTFANEQLQVGDTLDVMTPMGRFFTPLDPTNDKEYVAFAAGSGITPIMSILKAVLQIEPKSRFTLFYNNREIESIIFRDELDALKNQFMGRLSVHHILSREHMGSELFTGRIDRKKCEAFCKTLIQPAIMDDVFLCGPQEMTDLVKETLIDLGVEGKKVHTELFTAPGAKKVTKTVRRSAETDEDKSDLQIKLDGITFDIKIAPDENVLDAALKNGADLPYACKGGVCSTCRAKLVKGKVDMEVNYALEPDELEAGYILTCQAYPQSDHVFVDFDDQ